MNREKLKIFTRQNKKFFIAIIALLEAVIIVCVATFSWVEGTKNGYINNTSTVSAGEGLLFTGDNISDGVLTLPDVDLQDCSSVDGRNFFFPTTDNNDKDTISAMTFRKGTEADKNDKYISVDFNVQSYSNANLYIDNSSYVTCSSEALKALRVSLNFNDGTAPIVLCPGVNKAGYVHTNDSISSISNIGVATTTVTTSYPFASYNFSTNNPIATITADEPKTITLSIWLEGTDAACTTSNFSIKDIDFDLKLTTAADYTKEITFVDYSASKWVKDANALLFVIDKSNNVAYKMEVQSDGITYKTVIPDSVSDVYFSRYDPADEAVAHNVWANEPGVSLSDSDINTYYTLGQGSYVDKVNYGYWVDSSCTGVIDVFLTEANQGEIKFTNTNQWSDVRAYFFDGSGAVGPTFPGTLMTYYGKTQTGVGERDNFKIVVPTRATGVIFSGSGGQTVNISLADFKEGYYLNGTQTDGKYNVAAWNGTRNDGVFSNGSTAANIFFTSSKYGSAINKVNGAFKPTSAFDQTTNYGLGMKSSGYNDFGERVYHMIVPADAVIKFNGFGNEYTITPSGVNMSAFQKIGYAFTSPTSCTSWQPGDEWPK